jgi:hypothetical protein
MWITWFDHVNRYSAIRVDCARAAASHFQPRIPGEPGCVLPETDYVLGPGKRQLESPRWVDFRSGEA